MSLFGIRVAGEDEVPGVIPVAGTASSAAAPDVEVAVVVVLSDPNINDDDDDDDVVVAVPLMLLFTVSRVVSGNRGSEFDADFPLELKSICCLSTFFLAVAFRCTQDALPFYLGVTSASYSRKKSVKRAVCEGNWMRCLFE